MTMRLVPLGDAGPRVGALGLGCMVLTGMYGPVDPVESAATFHAALDVGVTLLDTADSYSDGDNERFLGPLVAPVRDRVVLSSKFGLMTGAAPGRRVDASPERVRARCEASLARLGTDHLDVYYLHRVDPRYPVEESVGAMAELVRAGLVRHLGLCEVFPDELRRAHAVHPIAALQSEWSLWARAMEPCLPVARQLGITLVPYGPLGRGFLTGAISAHTALAAGDRRAGDPRFTDANRAANLRLVDRIRELAAAKGVKPAQIALAWLWAQGDDVVPIPGLERRDYLADAVGALDVELTSHELQQLDAWFAPDAVAGSGDETHMRRVGVHADGPDDAGLRPDHIPHHNS